MEFEARIAILRREGSNDPESDNVKKGLLNLGFEGVLDVKVGKFVDFTIPATNARQARADAKRIADLGLANPNTEDFRVSVHKVKENIPG